MFLGSFLGYTNAYSITPTNIDNITSITVENGIYDDLYASAETSLTPTSTIPSWDFYTILHALFNGDTMASNTDFLIDNISDILIKRRMKGEITWTTIYHKSINGSDDFNITTYDKYNQTGLTYEYALIPVNNSVEYSYNTYEVDSKFYGSYLVENDSIFNILLDLKINKTRNKPSAIVTPLNNKYPKYISNSTLNYTSGDCDATVLEYDYSTGTVDETNAWKYRQEFLDFLTDGVPKVLKTEMGDTFIIQITSSPTESEGNYWNAPQTSFSWVQIGDVSSSSDLYNSGLLDVSSEWWMI